MRIGFDVAQTCGPRAGCAWYADSLARAMVEVAPEHEYFFYHQFGNWFNDETKDGTCVEHPSVRMPFWGMDGSKAREFSKRVGEEQKLPGDPEIVQSNSFQVIPTTGAKLVFVIYDVSFWVYPEFTTEANRLNCQYGVLEALKKADGFIFISESGRNEFERMLPGCLQRAGKPVAAIPLASRVPPKPKGSRKDTFWLAVGSIEPRKNYSALLSALEVYEHRSVNPLPLYIAASAGWKNERIKQRVGQLEAKGIIKLLGYVDDEQLASLYREAMALIFPSWYEGFGLPVLEAMQNGCPVICSDCTSLPEIGGDAPLYCDPSQPESICNAMILLEEDPAERKRRSAAGLLRAQQFSWQTTALRTLQFYQEVLGHESAAIK